MSGPFPNPCPLFWVSITFRSIRLFSEQERLVGQIARQFEDDGIIPVVRECHSFQVRSEKSQRSHFRNQPFRKSPVAEMCKS